MVSDWALWAGGMFVVLVNLLAWSLVRINDIPASHRKFGPDGAAHRSRNVHHW